MVATPAAVGAEVAAGAPVLVLESMKMETRLNAPFAATVRELHVSTGSQVETGAPLIRLEPTADAVEPAAVADVDLDLPAAGRRGRAHRWPTSPRCCSATTSIRPTTAARCSATSWLATPPPSAARTCCSGEIALLGVFADFAELSRNRPADEEARTELRVHSPREYFHSYLQTLDVDRSGLPELFSTKLHSVLGHYGITELERSPELEAAVFRIFLAQQRSKPDLAIVTAILRRWHTEPAPDDDRAAAVRELLDRVVLATQLRFPAVGDLARGVRFRWFDQPVVDRERADVLAGVPEEVDYLAAHPDAPDRARRMDALAAIPERIVSFLSERVLDGVAGAAPLLEVLIRRHYREYALDDLRSLDLGGRPVAVADYVLDDRPTHLVSTVGGADELTAGSALARVVAEQLALRTPEQQGVVDLYIAWPDAPTDVDELRTALHERLVDVPFAHEVRRMAVGVCSPGRAVTYLTFRPREGDLVEDELVRGLHPMVGRRLDLWRLRDFAITRLDAPEDVLLYHCIAKDNEADQRLVAMAQVRELAVVRDDDGRVSSLPQVERAIASCVEGIRRGAGPARDPRGGRWT